MKIKVLKKDGSIEPFMPEKIARVVKAAGLESKPAELLSKRVAVWVKNKAVGQISSQEIRDKVIEELKKINQYTANLFAWYEKRKYSEQNDY